MVALLAGGSAAPAADDYTLGPDSHRQEGVPQGTVTQQTWTSEIFAGTVRDYWVYVPAQYTEDEPACVMVFQDGGGFQNPTGQYRVPIVFDNLIHKREMPVTIGIFINPGVLPPQHDKALPRFNRSYEYDSPTDQYARFLLEEILPEVGRQYNLTKEGTGRAICGASSGGICAFNAAWHRPEEFSRVISFIGSFVNLRGGHSYASLIRKTEARPLRVFLQDGANDLDIYAGSWWIGNQDLAAALRFAGYEYRFVPGDGAHTGKHGGAILPDALRYIWKGYPEPPGRGVFPSAEGDPRSARPTVMSILRPGEEWELVSDGHRFTEGPAADAEGNVYFTDIPNNRIHKIASDGKVSLFAEDTSGANGLMFGPDGRLYACQNGSRRIVAYAADGGEAVVAEGLESNDLVVLRSGAIYVTDPNNQQVWHILPDGRKRVVDSGISRPNGIIVTPDQSQLIVADTRSAKLYAFRIEPDGSLSHKQAYFTMEVPHDRNDSGADGMAVDAQGRLYVATHLGIQVFDQAGRVNAIINKPQHKWLANVCFGGKELDHLYVTCADKVYRRKTRTKGVLHFLEPIVPPAPRL